MRDFMKRFGAILHEIDMSGNSSSEEYSDSDTFEYDKMFAEEEENGHSSSSSSSSSSLGHSGSDLH